MSLLHWIVSAAMSPVEPADLAVQACAKLAAVFDLPRVFAFLLDDGEPTVVSADATSNEQAPEAEETLFAGVVRAMLRNLGARPAAEPAGLCISGPCISGRSLDVLPLWHEGRLIGGVGLVRGPRRSLGDCERDLAHRVADLLASVLARARLHREWRLLSTAVEQTGEGVMITDTKGTILYVNPAFETMTGYRRDEALGMNPRILRSGEQGPDFYRKLWATIGSGREWRGRLVNRCKDGSLYTEDAVISPVQDRDGRIVRFVCLQRDVTRQVELEERHRHSLKLESVGQLASGVAHDFNNLLMAIMGHAELAQMRAGEQVPGELTESLEVIRKTAERAASLTSRLLSFSRRRQVSPQPVDLHQLIRDFAKTLRRVVPENVELELDLPQGEAALVWADPVELEQVLMNLAVNGADAMADGGRLTIATELARPAATAGATDGPGARAGLVRLRVSDTGTGIPAAIRDRIFEPFFTTKAEGKGTGLGLLAVATIVRKYGGSIEVDSPLGGGATFTLELPLLAADAIPRVFAEAPAAGLRGRETLCLVEDDGELREVVALVLRQHGYTVIEAGRGEEAIQRLEEREGSACQLLITDRVMPGMSSAELIRRLRERHPSLPILVISGHQGGELACGELPSDVVFLPKPLSPTQLLRGVREVLDGEATDLEGPV